MNTVNNKILFVISLLFITNCTKESCLNCHTYNMSNFSGDLIDFKDSLYICENDDMWSYIVWGSNNEIGGSASLIDLNKYQTGYRSVPDDDIDDDGILNNDDPDIDNDGVPNAADISPNGLENKYILELVICEKD